MDQMKIGAFISSCRKEKGLTQAKLAEQIGISDRAVSKWENGKSLPDASIMMELCDILGITVNDLLKGERVNMEENAKVSNEIILNLKQDNEDKARMLLKLEVYMGIVAIIAFTGLSVIGCILCKTDETMGMISIIVGTVCIVLFALVGVYIEAKAGYYECKECGHRYVPSYVSALMAPHNGRTRHMRCPHCGKKSWQKKVISK